MDDWFEAAGGGSPVDVQALLDAEAAAALWEMVALGALVSLGTSRDGGALGITVTVDGRWRRTYVRDSDDLVALASEALPAVRAAIDALTASSARGSRERGRKRL